MRAPVTGILISLALASAAARADTIHLKNGRAILADQVREKGNHYEYEVGDDSYAIPKSVVDRIEAGGFPVRATPSGVGTRNSADLPTFTPTDSLSNEGDLLNTIVKSGKVDPDALSSLESKGHADLSATGNFMAGNFEFEHGNVNESRDRKSTRLNSSHSQISYAVFCLQNNRSRRGCRQRSHLPRRRSSTPDIPPNCNWSPAWGSGLVCALGEVSSLEWY